MDMDNILTRLDKRQDCCDELISWIKYDCPHVGKWRGELNKVLHEQAVDLHALQRYIDNMRTVQDSCKRYSPKYAQPTREYLDAAVDLMGKRCTAS